MSSWCTIQIGDRHVGPGHPCFLIAEVGQAHDGSLGAAHAYIDAAATAGVDAVKFQTHIAAEESTAAEPFRVPFASQDESRYEYWRRMEFTKRQWQDLAAHAIERKLTFLSSPFSIAAVDLLDRLEMPAWKIGAGELNNLPMLQHIAKTNKPVILSTGMSNWSEIDVTMQSLRAHDTPVALLQCTSAYPCPAEQTGLNVLGQLREKYNCPVGLSDHSGKVYAPLAAVALGANIIETHITFSRECFGPDVLASLTPEETAHLVEGARFIEQALSNPVEKDNADDEMAQMRQMFRKSIVAARQLDAGHVITREDIAFKKPGTGTPAAQWEQLVGRVLKAGVLEDHLLSDDDFQ